uniref:G_PROTEIN_RECEP_F1_2 domain-containing protein n=1 Tax=Angiostrongylus cantonensis TaxID=6313 RepID=A0A0K0D9J8_ANGCA
MVSFCDVDFPVRIKSSQVESSTIHCTIHASFSISLVFLSLKVPCIAADGDLGQQICPTDIRLDPAYYAIYYTYMYTTFLAIGPLTLLILLNICVVFTVLTKRTAASGKTCIYDSDTISLILVVFFFIFCNFTALLVNFMEIILNNPNLLVYFVDLSNLLVVINGTANFFCYLIFGVGFRQTLRKVGGTSLILCSFRKKAPKLVWTATINGNDKLPEQRHALL